MLHTAQQVSQAEAGGAVMLPLSPHGTGRFARELGGEELETPALERAWAELPEGPL